MEETDEEVARLEAELLGRITGHLDRFASERPRSARHACDCLLSGIVAMFEEGDPRAEAHAAPDRVPCLATAMDGLGLSQEEWNHLVCSDDAAADRALLA
jgi:hypothetical protein